MSEITTDFITFEGEILQRQLSSLVITIGKSEVVHKEKQETGWLNLKYFHQRLFHSIIYEWLNTKANYSNYGFHKSSTTNREFGTKADLK